MMLDTLLSQRAPERGCFDRRAIERLMDDLTAGRERQDYPRWNLLELEPWHRRHMADAASPQRPGST